MGLTTPTSTLDRLFLAACFWLMSFGLRLIRLGNHLNQEN